MYVNELPPWPERLPYCAALVDLEEGPRMMSNVVECEFDEDGKHKVELDCEVVNQDGEPKVQGTAVAALPAR